MPVSKLDIFFLFCLVCSSCVEPFEPVLDENREVLVISGRISDQAGRYTVSVSRSSPYKKPEFQPVEFCVVNVTDQDGNILHYTDEGEGIYAVEVPESYLEVGDAVSLYVLTPDANEYRSAYDTILSCPGIDSVYYEFGTVETADPEKDRPGIQFYLDMTGEASDSRNILWQVEETWEYWASLIGNIRWNEDHSSEEYHTNGLFRCWKTFPLTQFYTATTRSLSSNELRRVALNFVTNETDRLSRKYSILVRQQSLSGEAYHYFVRLNEQAVESGDMYDVQPSSVPGNLYNVNDPGETVLGYFHATQMREERIFATNHYFDFPVPHISCEYEPLSVAWTWPIDDRPLYVYWEGPFMPSWTNLPECFDCRLQGGDTIRPSYWEPWP